MQLYQFFARLLRYWPVSGILLITFFCQTVAMAAPQATDTKNHLSGVRSTVFPALSVQEKKWIKQHPKLLVGAEPDWAPFDFVDANGRYSGVANDYLSLIAQKTGLKFEFEVDAWSKLLDKIRLRQIDILPAAFYTREREEYANYSSAYFQALDYFFIRNDLHASSLADLDGKRVAIPTNYAYAEQLAKVFPKITVVNVDTLTAAIEAVLENRADLLYDTYATLNYALKKQGINTIIPFRSAREIDSHPLHIISRKDQPELAAILQKALKSISNEEKQAIYERWIGFESQTDKSVLALSLEQQSWLAEHPVINLGSESDWPPYEFTDQNGRFQGLSADIIHLLEQRLGIHFNIITKYSWQDTLAKARTHEIDMVSSAVKTAEREKFLNFTVPFISPPSVIYTRKDYPDIHRLDDLNGKTVAIENAYYLHERLAKEYPKIKLLLVNTTADALKKLSYGAADAYVGNQGVANWVIEQNALTNLKIVNGTSFGRGDLRFGVRTDWPLLPGILNTALDSIAAEDLLGIRRKWLGVTSEDRNLTISSSERIWLDAHKHIHYAGNPHGLPYEGYNGNGKYTGLVAEYLQLIEQRLDIDLHMVKTGNRQEALQMIEDGKVELYADMIPADSALAQKYTASFLSNPIVIVMRDDEEFVENLKQIQHKKIAVVRGYAYVANIIKQYPNIDFYQVDTIAEGLTKVADGKIDALLETMATTSYQLVESGIANIRIVGKTEFTNQMVFGVTEEFLPLIPLLNRALDNITPAEKQKIHNLWGAKQTYAVRTDYSLVAKIAGALILLNGVFFYWNRKLKQEVQKRLASEREVRLLNERFALATELVSLGVWQWDLNSENSLVFDERMFAMYQIPSQPRVSFTDWLNRIHPDDRHLIKNLPNLIGQQQLEYRIIRPDGNVRTIYAGSTRVVDDRDGSIKIFGVNWDITERKQADAQFKAIIDGLPLTVLIADSNGLILLDNPQAKREISDHKSIIGRNTSEFYADPDEKLRILETLQKQGSISQRQVRYKISAKQTVDCLLSILPINYMGQGAWLAVIINLNERIKFERALAEAKDQAERANLAKSAFLANMSHEIRTPMNAIIGFTELLNEQIQEPRLKSYVKTIHSAGYTLLTLINDILDLSKIEAGKMTIQKIAVNPHEMFTELGNIFTMAIRKKNLDLILEVDRDIPESLMMDVTRLRQVLFNLLGNAVKFTDHGYIRLKARTANEDAIRSRLDLLIEIEDTGIGIPENEQEAIFSEFTQLDTSERQTGTGLGLSISRRLTELMGGSISLKSKYGQGSTFTIRLDQVDVATLKAGAAARFTDTLQEDVIFQPAQILVVDDIDNNRNLIKENFAGSQILVLEATNGLDAISVIGQHDIQLILMDIRMPIMDGYQAAQHIKAIKPQIPIIALTASVMQDDFERISCEHFNAYLKKPVLRSELINSLSEFLPHQRLIIPEQKSTAISLSGAELQVLPVVLEQLKQLNQHWQLVSASNNISAMKAFAQNLLKLAEQHDFTPLQAYAENLMDCIHHFDINGITTLLREFPDLQKNLQLASVTNTDLK